MSFLFATYLLLIAYIGIAAVIGMLREPAFNFLHVVIMGSFYGGAVVASLLSRKLIRMDAPPPAEKGAPRAAILLCLLLAAGAVVCSWFALNGTLAVPPRLKAAYLLADHFAGRWSVVLLFVVIAAMFCRAAIRVFKRRPPNPSIERTSSGKPAAASHVKR